MLPCSAAGSGVREARLPLHHSPARGLEQTMERRSDHDRAVRLGRSRQWSGPLVAPFTGFEPATSTLGVRWGRGLRYLREADVSVLSAAPPQVPVTPCSFWNGSGLELSLLTTGGVSGEDA